MRRRIGRGTWLVPLVAVLSVAAFVGLGPAAGGFTAAIKGPSSSAGSGSLQLAALTSGGTTECATTASASSASCSGNLAPNALAVTGTTQQTATTLDERGTITASSTTLTQGTCGPIPLANAAASTDPMLIRGTMTNAVSTSPPLTGATYATLDGSTGYAADVTTRTVPTAFSEALWFKTTSTSLSTGGTLLSLTNAAAATGATTSNDMLWLDPSGKVVFGVQTSANKASELTSTSAYNNGAWHLAVATVSSSTMSLYVDGASAGPPVSLTPLASYIGYTHVGYGYEPTTGTTVWTDVPSTPFLAGSVADAAIFSTTLTSAQDTTLYQAGSQTTWNSAIATAGSVPAVSSWTLGDGLSGVFTGTLGFFTTKAPCGYVDVTIGATLNGTTTCAAPTSSSACATPTSTVTLATLGATAVTIPSPTAALNTTLTVTTNRDSATLPAAYLGLHLNATESIAASATTFTDALTWPSTQNIVL